MNLFLKRRGICLFVCLAMLISVFAPWSGNQQPVKAAAGYYIRINKATNVVTVYKSKVNGVYKDPVKAFICSAGYDTPIGTFKTPAKYRWHELDGPSYGQYCTRITKGFLFHSVWYYSTNNNAISVREYNKLGNTASHGCVRLTVADAKWIYDNCSLGTEVNIFYGSSKNDPLGKPEAAKLNPNKRMDWCPTDPAPGNPYRKKQPKINGTKSRYVELGTKVDWSKGVTGIDSLGNTATKRITIKSNVNYKKEGTYKVIYTLIDVINHKITKTITVKVRDTQSPIIAGAKNHKVDIGSSPINLKKGVTAKTKAGVDVTKSLVVSGTVNYNKAGTYKITYTAVGKNGKKATKIITVTVVDNRKPEIEGTKDYVVEENSAPIDLLEGVTATYDNKDYTSKIVVSGEVDYATIGTYKITYKVTGANNSTATKTITVKVIASTKLTLKGVKDRTLLYSDALNDQAKEALVKSEAFEGVSAAYLGNALKQDEIKVTIDKLSKDIYQLTYEVKVVDGEQTYMIKRQSVFTLEKL